MPMIWVICSKSSPSGRRFMDGIGSTISDLPIFTSFDVNQAISRNLSRFSSLVVFSSLKSASSNPSHSSAGLAKVSNGATFWDYRRLKALLHKSGK